MKQTNARHANTYEWDFPKVVYLPAISRQCDVIFVTILMNASTYFMHSLSTATQHFMSSSNPSQLWCCCFCYCYIKTHNPNLLAIYCRKIIGPCWNIHAEITSDFENILRIIRYIGNPLISHALRLPIAFRFVYLVGVLPSDC